LKKDKYFHFNLKGGDLNGMCQKASKENSQEDSKENSEKKEKVV